MNSDFSFKKFQWKKIIVFALCMLMLVPQTAVFAADNAAKMEVVIDAKGSASGNAKCTVKVEAGNYEYTGKNIEPSAVVKYANYGNSYYHYTVAPKNYTVKYGKFDEKGKFKETPVKEVGYYYAQVKFNNAGKFKGISTQYGRFAVEPQVIQASAKISGKKISVSWKKLAKTSASKYEVKNCVTNGWWYFGDTISVKNMASSVKIARYENYKKNYVSVRAYKNVTYYDQQGHKCEDKIYGDWSKEKKVVFK